MQTEHIEDYNGYQLSVDEVGAIAFHDGKPAARSLDVTTLKHILDIIIGEERRHAEEYK